MRMLSDVETAMIAGGDGEEVVVTGVPFSDSFSGGTDNSGAGGGGGSSSHAQATRMAVMKQLGVQKWQFFANLEPIARKIAQDLHVPEVDVLGLMAFESGWLGDHAKELHNPLGLTQAGGADLSFGSYGEAAQKFEDSQAWRFGQGAANTDDFITDLQKAPAYNANQAYYDNLRSVINSTQSRLDTWNSRNDG